MSLEGFMNLLIAESIRKADTEEDLTLYIDEYPMELSKIRFSLSPPKDPMFYDYYDPLQKQDLKDLKDTGYFKIFYSPMSSLEQVTFTLTKSKSTGYWEPRYDPAGNGISLDGTRFDGGRTRDLYLSTTFPIYYQNHLLLTSKDQIPTYAFYYSFELFLSVAIFVKRVSELGYDKPFYVLHNGNLGSEKFHFHVHVTNQPSPFINMALSTSQDRIVTFGIFKSHVYVDNSVERLYAKVENYFKNVNSVHDFERENKFNLIAFFYYSNQDNLYYFIPSIIDPTSLNVNIGHSASRLFAPAGTVFAPPFDYNNTRETLVLYSELDLVFLKQFEKAFIIPPIHDLSRTIPLPQISTLVDLNRFILSKNTIAIEQLLDTYISSGQSSIVNMLLLKVFDVYQTSLFSGLSVEYLIDWLNRIGTYIRHHGIQRIVADRNRNDLFNIYRMLLSILLSIYSFNPSVLNKSANTPVTARLNPNLHKRPIILVIFTNAISPNPC